MNAKLFRNARIFTPTDTGSPLAGEQQGAVRQYDRGAIFVRNGLIEKIGQEADVLRGLSASRVSLETDCEGRCVIPGFTDPHTHMCFAERREAEFTLRLRGTPYLEILRKGGGILSSVRSVRAISEGDLFDATKKQVLAALCQGTTTLEIKSGYGLDTETELKMLRVIARIGRELPVDVVATFLGAHAIPEEYREDPDEFTEMIIDDMIPAVSEQGIARFCDVFCEEGVFSVDQSRQILEAAQEAGLYARLHADEVHDLGGAALAAELKVVSADHLLAVSDKNIAAMSQAGVIAVLLPGTAYSLRKPYARAREIIGAQVPVALATDCNPGSSFIESMPFIFGLAVMNMGLSPEEALVAITLNSAYAIRMARQVGSLDVGKKADFLIIDGESPSVLAYHAGGNSVTSVYKEGERIV